MRPDHTPILRRSFQNLVQKWPFCRWRLVYMKKTPVCTDGFETQKLRLRIQPEFAEI